MSKFEPVIVGFLCNWCSYTGADLAGTARAHYLPNVRIIRVMCSGRVEPTFVLKALQDGADGVLVAGCHPGDCHYQEGNYKTLRRMTLLKRTRPAQARPLPGRRGRGRPAPACRTRRRSGNRAGVRHIDSRRDSWPNRK